MEVISQRSPEKDSFFFFYIGVERDLLGGIDSHDYLG